MSWGSGGGGNGTRKAVSQRKKGAKEAEGSEIIEGCRRNKWRKKKIVGRLGEALGGA